MDSNTIEKNWSLITAAPTVNIYAYWKGTPIRIDVKGKNLLPIIKAAHESLIAFLREGDTIKEACDCMKEQLDCLELAMRIQEAKMNGKKGLQSAFLNAAWKDEPVDAESGTSLWLTNIIALLKAKAIEDDDNNGIQLTVVKGDTLVQYTELPPLPRI